MKIFLFIAMLLFYSLQNYYLNQRCIFFKALSSYTISGSSIKWHQCCSILTTSFIQHTVII